MSKYASDIVSVRDNGLMLRFLLLLIFGIGIAGALTYFMHVLIESSQQELNKSTRANLLDFVRVKRDETSQKKKLKPQRPETQDAPPAPPSPQQQQNSLGETSLAVSLPQAATNIDVEIGAINISASDGEYLPIVKIAPVYPLKAMASGKEGECTVEYIVTTNGSTKNVKPVEGQCPGIFMRASINAAKKFKYKPRVVDGKAIEVMSIRNKFIFKMSKYGDEQ
ncbi:energy transducer TonB [Thalassotalea sp. M1531]|uniref:Protein TonB n=1 Tax=Thalassotalea algicola TaxID=2716224 RepID=A0A7Y0LGK5_9GAMM|nr:energy transducer TonB [Thalassotalea algicola]NMP32830.1 energy transducer TonB [Thalassotalea algicola]